MVPGKGRGSARANFRAATADSGRVRSQSFIADLARLVDDEKRERVRRVRKYMRSLGVPQSGLQILNRYGRVDSRNIADMLNTRRDRRPPRDIDEYLEGVVSAVAQRDPRDLPRHIKETECRFFVQNDRRPTKAELVSALEETPLRKIFRFETTPIPVMSSFEGANANPADRRALNIISELCTRIGVHLTRFYCSGDPEAPAHYADVDLILICGPNRNALARPLNEWIQQYSLDAFCFKYGADPSQPLDRHHIHPECVIHHPKGLIQDIPPFDPDARKAHGLIFVGANPEMRSRKIIWMAGLEPYGTPAAAIALRNPDLQAKICRHLETPTCDFVSVLVYCEFPDPDDFQSISIVEDKAFCWGQYAKAVARKT